MRSNFELPAQTQNLERFTALNHASREALAKGECTHMTNDTFPDGDLPSLPDVDTPPPGGDLGNYGKNWETPTEFQLSDLQLRAIELTLQGHSDTRVAQALAISRRTLWNWKTLDDEYRQVLTDTRAQNFGSATDRYQHLLGQATTILGAALRDPDEKTRFKAAQVLLNMAGAFRPQIPKLLPPKRRDDDDDDWPAPVLPEKVG
jgi:DNA-binding CsgD family transcriptional regulator